MDNTGRILTLVCRISEEAYPEWIMASHLKGAVHGIKVLAIHEGDALKELEHAMAEIEESDLADDLDE